MISYPIFPEDPKLGDMYKPEFSMPRALNLYLKKGDNSLGAIKGYSFDQTHGDYILSEYHTLRIRDKEGKLSLGDIVELIIETEFVNEWRYLQNNQTKK